MNSSHFVEAYQDMLPRAWGLSGLQSMLLVVLIGVVVLYVLAVAIALLRGQPAAARAALVDCIIGTACLVSVLGSWIALFFFARAMYRAATSTYPVALSK